MQKKSMISKSLLYVYLYMIMNMKDIMIVPDVKVHHPQHIHLYTVS